MKRTTNSKIQIRQLRMRMLCDELILVWADRIPAEAPTVDLPVILENPGDALFNDSNRFAF